MRFSPREHLRSIFESAVERVDPYRMILDRVRVRGSSLIVRSDTADLSFDLGEFRSILVVGTGKASSRMAAAMEEILGDRLTAGLISVKAGSAGPLRLIEQIEAGHPIPDKGSEEAARRIAALCAAADERTLIVVLVSGGGSALLSSPYREPPYELTLQDKQDVSRLLLSCGATIQEFNCVRKHLSSIKGGRLAQLMHPATSVTLILSDVVGDRLDSIASGLTAPDDTTFEDAVAIARGYGIWEKLPAEARRVLEDGLSGRIAETPAAVDPVFGKVHNVLIGNNLAALQAARNRAAALGYSTVVLSSRITGEAREVAKFYLGIGRDIAEHGLLARAPACLIGGGETTVTIAGDGLGGRNQEMALSFLGEELADERFAERIFFLTAGTDGSDGPTDAAGAFVTGELLRSAKALGLDARACLQRNDSYHFFEKIGGLLKTGPTGTNVCDIQILIVEP